MWNYPSSKKLVERASFFKNRTLQSFFASKPDRISEFSRQIENLFFDFSKQPIHTEVFNLLIQLAEDAEVKEHTRRMFAGETINFTEKRKVLHPALRGNPEKFHSALSAEEHKEIATTLQRIKKLSEQVRNGIWKGCTGKKIEYVINIGIGGSDLGVAMAYRALTPYSERNISFHFVSNVDPAELYETLSGVDPETVLFTVVSKTFTTQETLANATAAKNWMQEKIGNKFKPGNHFVGTSSNIALAQEFGIQPENIYPLWDWVGGRYSLCSAAGLSLIIAVGSENFQSMLDGFAWADNHFLETEYSGNIPVIMALLGIWSINFMKYPTLAVLPYSHYLGRFPAYLQQLETESNGKSVNREGIFLDYQTAPVIWGEPGTNGQHAFYQAMHQGTSTIPADFIGFIESSSPIDKMHDLLMSNFFAQQEALAFGKSADDLRSEGAEESLISHRTFPGNRPSSCLLFQKLTPFSLGQLIGIYEHKVFTQGVIWKINSFDQWGVELGKKLAKNILQEIRTGKQSFSHDSSTQGQLNYYLAHKK